MYLIKFHRLKIYFPDEFKLHAFFTWTLDGGEWSAPCPETYIVAEGTHLMKEIWAAELFWTLWSKKNCFCHKSKPYSHTFHLLTYLLS
jgi:hypothetical protein